MRKRIKITEQQFNNIIKRTIGESNVQNYPLFIEHWENKFCKSVEILLKLGNSPDDLIKKIKRISIEKQENNK